MTTTITLKFITAVVLYIQLLMLIYLYSAHRVRFFRYLVWAWSLFVIAKASYITQQFFPEATSILPFFDAAGSAGDLLILAAGLAYRWGYRLRWYHAAPGITYALAAALLSTHADIGVGMMLVRRLVSGTVLFAAGVTFWPRPTVARAPRGARLLSVSLGLWGVQRLAMIFVEAPPGSAVYVPMAAMAMCFYFLSACAIIILVLNRAKDEVAALEEFNQRLVDGLGEGLELIDSDFTIRHANRWMEQQFGPVVGRRCYEVLTADGRQCPGCFLAQCHEMEAPARLHVAGPNNRRFLLTCSPVRQPDGQIFLLELVDDVTEQERLRTRLSEAERMAAVGELAAGLAHEIRNPLAAIVNAATLLEDEDTLTPEERASILEAVKQETRRLNTTLSDFLLFARPREIKRQLGDIRQVVEHVTALLQDERTRPGGVQIAVRVDPTIPLFAFDTDQLTQVLWNIALNGVEAMQRRGCLTLDVGRQNGEVLISIADTGPGIPPEERWRIFQPFFSKKPGGTGLGLSIAQRIITAHGGRIELESAPERGSRFTISLPLLEG
jgi:signal transduction histidine kinase